MIFNEYFFFFLLFLIFKRYFTFIFSLIRTFIIFIWIVFNEFQCSPPVLLGHKILIFWISSWLFGVFLLIFLSSLNLDRTVVAFSVCFQCYGRDTWSCFNFCSVVDYFFFFPFPRRPCLNAYMLFFSIYDLRVVRMCVDGGCSHQFRLERGEWTLFLHILRCFLNSNIFCKLF